jgi:hypothetical protein
VIEILYEIGLISRAKYVELVKGDESLPRSNPTFIQAEEEEIQAAQQPV